jgi:hypothetical protein
MTNLGKDSKEVTRFMALFSRLKNWSDDDPRCLADLASRDSGVAGLCAELHLSVHFMKVNERRVKALIAVPVDPDFIAAWRDYEDRYAEAVLDAWFADLGVDIDLNEPSLVPKAEMLWKTANDEAAQQAGGIADAIEFAQFNIDQNDRWLDQPDFKEGIEEGITAWERLERETGFDLQGIFRRRALVPFVLVPRKVASRHGSAEKLSMLKNLEQAHDAFVYGAFGASLALMRSVIEVILRDHYRSEGKNLNERIRNTRGRLPAGANEAALHRLRKLANATLHLDHEGDEGLPNVDELGMEKELVSFLRVVRALIEAVK